MKVEKIIKATLTPEEKHAIKVLATIRCPGVECNLCPMYKSLQHENPEELIGCCVLVWAKDMNTTILRSSNEN